MKKKKKRRQIPSPPKSGSPRYSGGTKSVTFRTTLKDDIREAAREHGYGENVSAFINEILWRHIHAFNDLPESEQLKMRWLAELQQMTIGELLRRMAEYDESGPVNSSRR